MKKRKLVSAAVFSLSVMAPAAGAWAGDSAAEKDPPAAPSRNHAGSAVSRPEKQLPSFALTISPLHLFLPVLELTGEVRVGEKIGVAGIVGIGKVTDKVNGTNDVELSASVFEAGAQFRYYLVGDFRHGMQLGAEVLYLHLSSSELSVKGAGLAVGPFVGYKYTAPVGFTVEAQLGAEYVGTRASSNTTAQTASDSDVIPLLNINVGWSF